MVKQNETERVIKKCIYLNSLFVFNRYSSLKLASKKMHIPLLRKFNYHRKIAKTKNRIIKSTCFGPIVKWTSKLRLMKACKRNIGYNNICNN